MGSPSNPFGSGNSNFMTGFTGQLTNAMNQVLGRQLQSQQQEMQQNQALIGALIQGGSPEVQALGLSLLQNPKALKNASKLFQTPEYQQILAITQRAHQAGGAGGAGPSGVGAASAGPPGLGAGQTIGTPPPTTPDPTASAGASSQALTPGMQLARGYAGMPPLNPLGGAAADTGSTSATPPPQPPSPPSAAMPATAPATGGAMNLTPAAGATPPPPPPAAPASLSPGAPAPSPVGAPPPSAGGQPAPVGSYQDFKTYMGGAANSVYAQARDYEDKIAADIAQRNPLNYQKALEKAIEPVRQWEQEKFKILAHMQSVGQGLEASGVPWQQAQSMMSKEFAPLSDKAQAPIDLEKVKQQGREHLEGVTKPQAKVNVFAATEPTKQADKIAQIETQGRLTQSRMLQNWGKPEFKTRTDPQGGMHISMVQRDPNDPTGFKVVGDQKIGHKALTQAETQTLMGTVNAQKLSARLLGLKDQIEQAGGDVSWPEAKLNAWMYSNGMDPGQLQAAKQQLAGAYNANILSSLGRGSRLHAVAEQFLSHLPQRGDEGKLFWEKVAGLTPIISDTQGTVFQITGTAPSDFGIGGPPPTSGAAPAAGGGSPEGTIISNGSQQMVKRGGQWVPYP